MYNFDDYLLENVVNTLPFKISGRLKDLLKSIDHTIARTLLSADRIENDSEFTLLDFDDDDFSRFRYVVSNKAYDTVYSGSTKMNIPVLRYMRSDYEYQKGLIDNLKKFYVTTSIGKAINKIFPNEFPASGQPGEDIESFTNMVKHKRSTKFDNFKLVEGEDIVKYYNSYQYSSNAEGSTLGSSCMRRSSCSDFIKFYSVNKGVKLLILYSDNEREKSLEKIVGRALVWDIAEIDGEKVEKPTKFMDRIYTVYDYDILNFKDYAEKEGWFYKDKQNMSSSEYIVNPTNGKKMSIEMKTTDNFITNPNSTYPYMDTMKWFFYEKGYLSNSDSVGGDFAKYLFMEHTNGEADEGVYNGVYVSYYDRYFRPEEVRWCEYGEEYRLPEDAVEISRGTYATKDYMDENMVWSDLEDKWLDKEDSYYSEHYDDWFSERYRNNHMVYCDRDDQYYMEDDCVYSNFYSDYILEEDSIEVFTKIDKSESDYTYEWDEYITVHDDEDDVDYHFSIDLEEYFIQIQTSVSPVRYIWDYEYNRGKYFKKKGMYYLKKFEDELTGQLKLNL